MKFLYDYFPIICFFISYKLYGIFVATGVTMAASLLQVGLFWLKYRRFETLHVVTLAFVLVLGASTLIFHNAMFIKWKPSVIYWVFSLVFLGSSYFTRKTVLERMLGNKIALPAKIWQRTNIAWGLFFAGLGGLNLYVVYHYTTNQWVNFKLFGTLGILIVFIIAQTVYIARYATEIETPENPNRKHPNDSKKS